MRKTACPFRMPHRPLVDNALSFTARRLCAAFYSLRSPIGTCCSRSIAELSALVGGSIETTVKNIRELEEHGYISHRNTRRFNEALGHMVYAENIYFCLEDVSTDYTLVPKGIFSHHIQASSLVVLLYLYFQAGNESRAFPSLSNMSKKLHMGRSTVCRALAELEVNSIVYIEHCLQHDHSYHYNSYFPIQRVTESVMQDDTEVLLEAAGNNNTSLVAFWVPVIFGQIPCHYTWLPAPTKRWKPPFGWG